MSHDDGAQHLHLVERVVILLEHGETVARGDVHDAARRLDLAREELEECRFARAVCANDTVAVAGREFQVDILIEDAFAEL